MMTPIKSELPTPCQMALKVWFLEDGGMGKPQTISAMRKVVARIAIGPWREVQLHADQNRMTQELWRTVLAQLNHGFSLTQYGFFVSLYDEHGVRRPGWDPVPFYDFHKAIVDRFGIVLEGAE